MVAPVTLLHMCGHSCLNPWISTELSSIRRCKYSDIFQVRTGNKTSGGTLQNSLDIHREIDTYIHLLPRFLCQKNIISLLHKAQSKSRGYRTCRLPHRMLVIQLNSRKLHRSPRSGSLWTHGSLRTAFCYLSITWALFKSVVSPFGTPWKQSLSQLLFPL